MKALVGVDVGGECHTASALLRALQFDLERVVLLNAVEAIIPDASYPEFVGPEMTAEMINECEEAGRRALESAGQEWSGETPIEKKLILGDPVRSILDVADEQDIDLIAVTSHKKSSFEAFMVGSVTRGLLTGSHHSFLAAKPFREGVPLTVVLATDHSDYANRSIELFARFAPKGIGKLFVATVLDPKARRDLARSGGEPWSEERILRENRAVCDRLGAVCSDCTPLSLRGDANSSLRDLMRTEKADLLVVGAQGHGFLERLRSGSVSFHQVVSEDYSVLVLRS